MTRSLLIAALIIGLVAAAFYLASTLLLIFGAILLAALLDAAINGVVKISRLPRGWAMAIVIFLGVMAFAVATALGGWSLINQFDDLWAAMVEAWDEASGWLADRDVPVPEDIDWDEVWDLGPDMQSMFGRAGSALGMTADLIGNIVFLVLIALFLAANPAAYRDGFLKLVPRRSRPRLGEVMNQTGSILKWWLVGQLVLMTIIAISTTILLLIMGIPYAILLGLIAGLLNFIPFLGPILAMVPIILAVIGQDLTTAIIVLVGYTAIQQIEGNILSPMIQQRVVHLPPATNIAFLLIMGVLFGGMGVALATPILAAVRVMTLELYVRDVLGDPDPHKTSKSGGAASAGR